MTANNNNNNSIAYLNRIQNNAEAKVLLFNITLYVFRYQHGMILFYVRKTFEKIKGEIERERREGGGGALINNTFARVTRSVSAKCFFHDNVNSFLFNH